MIEALLTTGALVWAILGIETILLLYWIDREYSGLATGSVLVVAAMLQWICKIDIIGYITLNPVTIAYVAGGYFITGTVWAVIKWWFFVRAERRKYDDFRASFCEKYKLSNGIMPTEYVIKYYGNEDRTINLKEEFKNAIERLYGDEKIEIRPNVGKHKERIFLWMIYWPWSGLWTIISDPVRRIFTEIYTQIKATLQRISDRVWAGTENDF